MNDFLFLYLHMEIYFSLITLNCLIGQEPVDYLTGVWEASLGPDDSSSSSWISKPGMHRHESGEVSRDEMSWWASDPPPRNCSLFLVCNNESSQLYNCFSVNPGVGIWSSEEGDFANLQLATMHSSKFDQLTTSNFHLHRQTCDCWIGLGIVPSVRFSAHRVSFCTRHMSNDSQSQSTFAASQSKNMLKYDQPIKKPMM